MRFRFSRIALAVAATLPSLASAVDFSYSGFGTAAYAQSDTDEAQFGYTGQPNGIDSSGSFEIDSKVGLQVTARFNDVVSATVQGVAYADLTGDWEPRLDWAYLRLQPISGLSVRAGYLRAPIFMYSDSVFIGYANVWVRPPMEIYNMSPVYQMRGVDVTWRGTFGPVAVSVNPYYGDSEVDLPSETLDVPEWYGVAATAEYGSVMFRVGYADAEIGTTNKGLAPLIENLRAVPALMCPTCASEADRTDLKDKRVKIWNVGVQYDDGKNFVAAEYAHMDSQESYVLPNKMSAYATYGRRFANLMPYVTYAISDRYTSTEPSTVPIAVLREGVNYAINYGYDDQTTYSVGARYELPSFSIVKGAIVKLQYDHIRADHGTGMLNNATAKFDGDVDMISASFDFIF
jgi:hypothetical protein